MKELPETLTLGDLADNEWGKLMSIFIKSKMVISEEKIESSDDIRNAYIRHKQGKGVSDDAAIIIAGTLYGEEAFWGAYLFDAIDTWDKYATYIFKGGADERFGEEIKPHINITDDEVIRFIYLARKENGFPDSSQRYFLQIDKENNQNRARKSSEILKRAKLQKNGIRI